MNDDVMNDDDCGAYCPDCDDDEGCEETAELGCSAGKWYRLEVRSEVDADIPVAFVYVQAWDEKMASCLGDFFAAGYHVVDVVEVESPLDCGKGQVADLEAKVKQLEELIRFQETRAGALLKEYAGKVNTLRDGVFALNRGQAAQTQMLAQMLDVVK